MTTRPPLLLVLVLGAGLLAACTEEAADRPGVAPAPRPPIPSLPDSTLADAVSMHVGEPVPAPDVSLPGLHADSVRLRDFHGQVVLVNVWATWCPPCRMDLPDLNTLHSTLHPQDFSVVGIAVDEAGAGKVAPFAEAFGIAYPVALDPDGRAAEAFGGVFSLPASFVLDRHGRIVYRHLGRLPLNTLRPMLEEMLEGGERESESRGVGESENG